MPYSRALNFIILFYGLNVCGLSVGGTVFVLRLSHYLIINVDDSTPAPDEKDSLLSKKVEDTFEQELEFTLST